MRGITAKHVTCVSEVLAASAILASAVTFVADKWHYSKQVYVSASVVTSSPRNLSLLVSNDGQIDVAIKQVTIEVPGYGFTNPVNLAIGGELLQRNTSKLLKSVPSSLNSSVIADAEDKDSKLSSIEKTDCNVKIRYVSANDEQSGVIPLKLKCYAASIVDPEELKKIIGSLDN